MNILQVLGEVKQVYDVLKELEQDGALTKLKDALNTVLEELKKEDVQALIQSLEKQVKG